MLREGQLVGGRFRALGRAAAGGYGVVHKAKDDLDGSIVALKVLREADTRALQRFEREATILRDSSDPRVVRYVAHGVEDDVGPYLVMEWLRGETLLQRMERAGLTHEEVVRLGISLAEVLGGLHERGVIHRDLKPSNVFLVDGRVSAMKLLDFGIARSEAHTVVTATGAILGTAGYMSPEQAEGEIHIGARSDVFSLGCLLFHCAAGRLPFEGQSGTERLLRLALSPAPRADAIDPTVSTGLSDVLAWLLEKQPRSRPADMSEVARALRDVQVGGGEAPTSLRAPSITSAERRFASLLVLERAPPAGLRAATLAAASKHGGVLFEPAQGAFIVTFSSRAVASDLARSAARAAVSIRHVWPEARGAVLSARGEGDGTDDLAGAVQRAEALVSSGPAKAIVVDDATRGLLGVSFETAYLPAAGAHLLIGEQRWARGAAPGRPFVGREREVAAIEDAYHHASSERMAEVVVVLAPAGTGKSRLVAEAMARLARARPCPHVLLATADDGEAASPFGSLTSALRHFLGLPYRVHSEGGASREAGAVLRASLAQHVPAPELDHNVVFLAHLLQLGGDPSTGGPAVDALRAAETNPALMTEQVRRAIESLFRGLLSTGPVVMVLEDLHWTDGASVAFLHRLLGAWSREPLLVVATGRPETTARFPRLFEDRSLTTLQLRELGPRAAEELARILLGKSADESIVRRVATLAGGHPFYLEEIARAVAGGLGGVLPESVVAMVQTQLDRLEEPDRRALRAASVFGATFSREAVSSLLGGEPTLDEILQRLATREILTHFRAPAGEHQYSFRHAILRETAYATISEADLPLAHGRAAEWLAGQADVGTLAVARHFELAGESGRAAPWYLRAARQALWADDFPEALRCADKALEHTSEPAARAAALCAKAETQHLLWQSADAGKSAEEAMALLPAGSALWFLAAQDLVRARYRLGDADGVCTVNERLLATQPDPGTTNTAVHALSIALLCLAQLGRFPETERVLARIDAFARDLPSSAPARLPLLVGRGSLALARGDIGAFRALRVEAAHGYDRILARRRAFEMSTSVAYADVLLGRYEQAIPALRSHVARGEEPRMGSVNVFRQNLGLALLGHGRHEEARAELEPTIAPLVASGNGRYETASRHYLARALVELGDLEEAEKHVRAALVAAGDITPSRLEAHTAMAHVLLAQGNIAEAVQQADEAGRLLAELGTLEDCEIFCRATLARVRFGAGDEPGGKEALARAYLRVVEMGNHIQDLDLRKSFLENVPENRWVRQTHERGHD